jgi:hypothetical protein
MSSSLTLSDPIAMIAPPLVWCLHIDAEVPVATSYWFDYTQEPREVGPILCRSLLEFVVGDFENFPFRDQVIEINATATPALSTGFAILPSRIALFAAMGCKPIEKRIPFPVVSPDSDVAVADESAHKLSRRTTKVTRRRPRTFDFRIRPIRRSGWPPCSVLIVALAFIEKRAVGALAQSSRVRVMARRSVQ